MTQTFTPMDARHSLHLILKENRGSLLTEALCIGICETAMHYWTQTQLAAENAVKLAEQEKG